MNDIKKENILNNKFIDKKYLKLNNEEFIKLFEKKISYIFGKNGSGKTTISRYIKENFKDNFKLFIFNKDYVKKNIFIQNDDNEVESQKINPKNKKNTFNIFFGEKLITLTQELTKNEENKKIIKDYFIDKFEIISFLENKNRYNEYLFTKEHLDIKSKYNELLNYQFEENYENILEDGKKGKIILKTFWKLEHFLINLKKL
ncbi:MAG: hypothetical protein ACRCRP_02565 [Metamycoplasmataceae bacterium]